jgi:hypothetical protein
VQVAEHLDADGLVQAADADRFVAAGADQVSDQVAVWSEIVILVCLS